jgi:hypothetical protein
MMNLFFLFGSYWKGIFINKSAMSIYFFVSFIFIINIPN